MRTTLTIADDVLTAAKALADADRRTVGEVISDLARRALQAKSPLEKTAFGVPLLPRGPHSRPVTVEMVNRLREELE